MSGFAAAGAASFAGHVGPQPKGYLSGLIKAAVVGGVASRIGGGKFENGAVSGAFTFMFNDAAQKARSNYGTQERARFQAEQRTLMKASNFRVGDKDFVIRGGTLAEKQQIQTETREILATPRGAQMLTELESRRFLWVFKKEFTIDLTVTNRAYTYPNSDAVYVDPNFHPSILTTSGTIPATTHRIIAHEFGHAVFGDLDDGVNNLNNVNRNENPIMNALGEPSRTRY